MGEEGEIGDRVGKREKKDTEIEDADDRQE